MMLEKKLWYHFKNLEIDVAVAVQQKTSLAIHVTSTVLFQSCIHQEKKN